MGSAGPLIPFPRERPASTGDPIDAEAGRGAASAPGPDALVAWLQAVARRRDRAAFTALVRHFAPRIRAYLLRGAGDPAWVDDVLQETFAAVWQKADSFDSRRAGVAAWIFAIARNRRIDAFRRDRRPEYDPLDPAFLPDPRPDGEQAVAARQRVDAVRSALATLSGDQREVLRLSFYEGETYAAIAVRLGVPLGTVKSRARLAFRRLRTTLAAHREELR